MSDQVFADVQTAVAEALGVEADEVGANASLLDDLGAESIDLLDMLFRIERKTGVKIKAAQLQEYITGGMPDEAFGTSGGVVSEAGLAHLKTIMPQIDQQALAAKLPAEKVINLFTVQNLADMVASRNARVAP